MFYYYLLLTTYDITYGFCFVNTMIPAFAIKIGQMYGYLIYFAIPIQLSRSRSIEYAALAGEVDGSSIAFPNLLSSYLLYNEYDFAPLQNIAFISAESNIIERSFGITFEILASDEPSMEQEPITSNRAIPFSFKSVFLSSIVFASIPVIFDNIGQNLFILWA